MTLTQLLSSLTELEAKATPCKDVQVEWYSLPDGTRVPQFETERGGIAQEEADYELYCACRNALPRLVELVGELERDAERLEWIFSTLNDDEIRERLIKVSDAHALGGMSGPIRVGDFRAAIDAALNSARKEGV